jgi:hypothetical protein
MSTIKVEGDLQLGQVNTPNPTDIFYLLRDPYNSTGDDGYVEYKDLFPGVPVYNALTDGGIDADYTDRLNPGTDQRANIISWIETNGLPNGKRRFYFPAGHYQWTQGSDAPGVLDIQGYDGVEIYGDGMGKTVFHVPQDFEYVSTSNGFFRIGWQTDQNNTYLHDFTIQVDPYTTLGRTDGTAEFGWVFYPVWTADTAYEKGDRVVSVADDYVIEYQEDATSASTEPTWSPGSMLEGGLYSVEVQSLANWQATTTYATGAHAKFPATGNLYQSVRSLGRCTSGGDSGSTEPVLYRPSGDGTDTEAKIVGIEDSYKSRNPVYERIEFVGMAGFDESGGGGIKGIAETKTDGMLVTECIFRDFQYGTAIGGVFNNARIINNRFERTGGWGFQYGTVNAHVFYAQGGRNLYAFNRITSHYAGIDIKIHTAADNQDLTGNRLIGNIHANFGDRAVQFVTPGSFTVDDNPDFIPQTTSGNYFSATVSQGNLVADCHFRTEKSAYDAGDYYGEKPGRYPAVTSAVPGTVVTGCTFLDCHGIEAQAQGQLDYDGTTVSIQASNCSFRSIFRRVEFITGAVFADNCEWDFRAIDLSASGYGITLDDYASIQGSRIFADDIPTGDRYDGFINIAGKHVKIENSLITVEGTGYLGFHTTGAAAGRIGAVFRNNKIIAPSATMYWQPGTDAQNDWLFEGNYWDIASWSLIRQIGSGTTWRNERGNLWGETVTGPTGNVISIATSNYGNKGLLVDIDGAAVTDVDDIYGVAVETSQLTTPRSTIVAIDAGTFQWVETSALVAAGDYVKLSATAGKVDPNGTSGSTTKPTSGFIGIVSDAGTASAGAGKALIEVLEWNRSVSSAPELGEQPIYNAVTDGGITADYTDRLSNGTDQRADIITWIETGLTNGKRRFFFPAGHYLVSEGVATGAGVCNIDGYDNVEIFGIRGKTVFHTPQGMDLKYKNRSLFSFGLTSATKNSVVRDITFVVDPYVTNSLGSNSDNGIKWGWKYYEPHRTSQAYEKGDYIVSTNDNWLILYTSDGVSASTEPTWSGATTTDGTASVTVVALNNWQPSTSYTAGDHVKTTLTTGGVHNKGNLHGEAGDVRSIMWASNSGTSGATTYEPQLALPSNDGTSNDNDDPSFEWIGFSFYASNSYLSGCEFSGMAGFGQAGGTALGMVEGGGGLVEDCYFHDAQYGGVVTGYYDNWTFRDCKHYKLGGWGFLWGTFNAHAYYCQGARNLWENCRFDSHFYGLDIKVHPNVPNNDVWQTRIIGCVFSNPGWSSIEWVGPGHLLNDSVTDGPDFIEEGDSGSTHSGALSKQGNVIGCTFRVYKSAWDDFDWRRSGTRPTSGGGAAIRVNTDGINIVGCDFTDMFGIISGSEEPAFGTHNPVNVTGCSFQTIYRAGYPFQGTVWASNCTFDFRALGTLSPPTVCVALEEYSRLVDSSIMAHQTQTGDPDNGVLRISGNHVIVDNVQIELVNTGHPVSFGSGSGTIENVTMTNCQVHAPNGTMYCYPGSGSRYWKFKDNYWNIGGWDYFRFVQSAHETWVWENEKGNFFTCRWDGTYKDNNSGTVRLIPTTGRSFNGAGYLIDSNAGRVTDVADIYGVELEATDHSAYHSFVAVDEGKNHWIHVDALVAKGDWLILSATSGKLAPNGTSGSTTRPASGIQARVIDAGTASAGAGRAHVEVLQWNLVAAGSGSVSDAAYGVGWDTDTTTAASKNAIYDKVDAMDTAIALNTAKDTNATHTGDVTGDTALTIANSAVTLAKMADMATASLLGRDTAGTGAPEVLSASEARTLLGVSADTDTRLNTLWIPAVAMVPATTNGATAAQIETSTNAVMIDTIDFDTATQEYAQFTIGMPKSWNESTVTVQFLWSHPTTATNFGVAWSIESQAHSDQQPLDSSWNTAVITTDTGATADDLYMTAFSSAVGVGSPAEGDAVIFRVSRAVANGSDNMAVDARLHGIRLRYTSNNITDA